MIDKIDKAEEIVTKLLDSMNNLSQMNEDMHNGNWNKTIRPGIKGKTIVFINLDKEVAELVTKMLKPFGTEVICVNI